MTQDQNNKRQLAIGLTIVAMCFFTLGFTFQNFYNTITETDQTNTTQSCYIPNAIRCIEIKPDEWQCMLPDPVIKDMENNNNTKVWFVSKKPI